MTRKVLRQQKVINRVHKEIAANTDLEERAIELLIQARPRKEIAKELGITVPHVNKLLSDTFQKMTQRVAEMKEEWIVHSYLQVEAVKEQIFLALRDSEKTADPRNLSTLAKTFIELVRFQGELFGIGSKAATNPVHMVGGTINNVQINQEITPTFSSTSDLYKTATNDIRKTYFETYKDDLPSNLVKPYVKDPELALLEERVQEAIIVESEKDED